MFCKRIDRYVGGTFLAVFAGTLCLMAALYMVFDAMSRIEDVRALGIGAGMSMLASYYANLLPLFLVDIAPATCLVAAGMVLVMMVKRRELLVLKACGTSVHRVTAPVFFWTLVISLAMFAVREGLGAGLSRRTAVLDHVLGAKLETQLLLTDAQFNRQVLVAEYNAATDGLKGVTVLEFTGERKLGGVTHAAEGSLAPDGAMVLRGVEVQRLNGTGRAESRTTAMPELRMETGLDRFDFVEAAEEDADSQGAFYDLNGLRRRMREYPDTPYFRVVLHSRLASFFSPLLLLLVGIPCLIGFERSVNSVFLGVIVSIFVASAYYALTFVLLSMGNSDTIGAPLAGWLPVIVVGSLGLWLFEIMLS